MSEVIQSPNEVTSLYFSQSRSEMLTYIPQGTNRLLDVGCGTGEFGAQLKSIFKCEVWGIELVNEVAVVAKTYLDKVIINDINIAINDLPDAYFDCISCNDVLEHLVDPFTVLKSLKSKLMTKGVIVCSIPNVRYWDNLKSLVLHKQWKYEDSGILDRTHLRFFTELSLREMFVNLGFDIIQMEGINPSRSRNLALLNFLTGGSLKDAKYLQFACVIRPSQML